MIPFIPYDELVAKLKLGMTGLAKFKRPASRFFLTDSAGNRLSRVRKEDWQRVIEEQPVNLTVNHEGNGKITTTIKYNFAHKIKET